MWDRIHLLAEEPGPHEDFYAAVLAALFEDEHGDVRVILTKRPDTMPTHAGHIALPGGRPDPGDGGPVGTALREAYEEVGIEPDSIEILGFLPPINTVEFTMWVVPVVGRVRGELTIKPSEREVARVFEPRLADLAEDSRWKFEIWNGRQIWFFDLEGEILWGATARMIRQLVGLDPLLG